MERREALGTYFMPGSFNNPDDYLAFIGENAGRLIEGARKGYHAHGRGIVLLQGPVGPGFVQSWYVTCEPEDFAPFPPSALEDWQGYDPGHEVLVGVTDLEESFLWFWRAKVADRT
jgi:hypothetical protein